MLWLGTGKQCKGVTPAKCFPLISEEKPEYL